MKREYLIYKLSEEMKEATRIDNELFPKFDVKRGLRNEDGTPNTAHSLNPVPCVYVTGNKAAKVEDGRLADVAPTILKIMGLEAPADMNGQILIK